MTIREMTSEDNLELLWTSNRLGYVCKFDPILALCVEATDTGTWEYVTDKGEEWMYINIEKSELNDLMKSDEQHTE